MSHSTLGLSEALQQYLLDVSLHEPDVCERLRQQTVAMPEARMLSSPEQVQLYTPLPSTYSALMYHTGLDPWTRKPIFVEKDEVVLSANIHNYLKKGKKVKARLELDGDCLKPMDGSIQFCGPSPIPNPVGLRVRAQAAVCAEPGPDTGEH